MCVVHGLAAVLPEADFWDSGFERWPEPRARVAQVVGAAAAARGEEPETKWGENQGEATGQVLDSGMMILELFLFSIVFYFFHSIFSFPRVSHASPKAASRDAS